MIFSQGANLPFLVIGIVAGGTSKERELVQRLGRTIRYEENKKAILIRVYVKNTQDEKWMKQAQAGYTVQEISSVEEIKL